MAIQTGVIKFSGKLGSLMGRKVGAKHIIQEPGGFTAADHKKKKRKDIRVRENYAEFGKAVNFATAIYNTPNALHSRTHRGGRAYNDLIKKLVALQRQFDTTHKRGERQAQAHMLDFLIGMPLNTMVEATWTAEPIFHQSAPLEVTASIIPPDIALKWPNGANTCALFFYVAELNFDTLTRSRLHYIHHPITDINAPQEVTIPLFEGPTIVLAGLEFHQLVNDKRFLFENRSHNPLYIAFAKYD